MKFLKLCIGFFGMQKMKNVFLSPIPSYTYREQKGWKKFLKNQNNLFYRPVKSEFFNRILCAQTRKGTRNAGARSHNKAVIQNGCTADEEVSHGKLADVVKNCADDAERPYFVLSEAAL